MGSPSRAARSRRASRGHDRIAARPVRGRSSPAERPPDAREAEGATPSDRTAATCSRSPMDQRRLATNQESAGSSPAGSATAAARVARVARLHRTCQPREGTQYPDARKLPADALAASFWLCPDGHPGVCPRGGAWSPRRPVTAKITGSSPVEGAQGRGRQPRQPDSKPGVPGAAPGRPAINSSAARRSRYLLR